MELKTNNIIYYVETLEDLFDLAEKLDKLGCKWNNGDSLIDKECLTKIFSKFPQMCLDLKNRKVTFDIQRFYEKEYSHIPIVTYRREQVDVQVNKKPIVPQIAVDYYNEYKDVLNTFEEWFSNLYDNCFWEEFPKAEKLTKWLYDNDDKTNCQRELALATLIVNGIDAVEVEKEKLYTVEIPNPKYKADHTVLFRDESNEIIINLVSDRNWRSRERCQLTEEEIKRDFEWAWQFAEEVQNG